MTRLRRSLIINWKRFFCEKSPLAVSYYYENKARSKIKNHMHYIYIIYLIYVFWYLLYQNLYFSLPGSQDKPLESPNNHWHRARREALDEISMWNQNFWSAFVMTISWISIKRLQLPRCPTNQNDEWPRFW